MSPGQRAGSAAGGSGALHAQAHVVPLHHSFRAPRATTTAPVLTRSQPGVVPPPHNPPTRPARHVLCSLEEDEERERGVTPVYVKYDARLYGPRRPGQKVGQRGQEGDPPRAAAQLCWGELGGKPGLLLPLLAARAVVPSCRPLTHAARAPRFLPRCRSPCRCHSSRNTLPLPSSGLPPPSSRPRPATQSQVSSCTCSCGAGQRACVLGRSRQSPPAKLCTRAAGTCRRASPPLARSLVHSTALQQHTRVPQMCRGCARIRQLTGPHLFSPLGSHPRVLRRPAQQPGGQGAARHRAYPGDPHPPVMRACQGGWRPLSHGWLWCARRWCVPAQRVGRGGRCLTVGGVRVGACLARASAPAPAPSHFTHPYANPQPLGLPHIHAQVRLSAAVERSDVEEVQTLVDFILKSDPSAEYTRRPSSK